MTEYYPGSESLSEEPVTVQGAADAGFPASQIASLTTPANSTASTAPAPQIEAQAHSEATPLDAGSAAHHANDEFLDLQEEARAAGITLPPPRSPRRKGRRLVQPQPDAPP